MTHLSFHKLKNNYSMEEGKAFSKECFLDIIYLLLLSLIILIYL